MIVEKAESANGSWYIIQYDSIREVNKTMDQAKRGDDMARQSIFDMRFQNVYSALIQKAERKGRTKEEVYEVACWLTGYSAEQIDAAMGTDITYGSFFSDAPAYNPRSDLITGKICGIQIETIEDPLMKKIRQLDKLVDELARGKPMERILRQTN